MEERGVIEACLGQWQLSARGVGVAGQDAAG